VASAATITPNTTADEFGENASACGLREAIQAANMNAAFGGCSAGSGADTIQLDAGTYTVTRPGSEQANVNGSFDITEELTIVHSGTAPAVIDGGGLDRTLNASTGTFPLTISGVTVTNGNGSDGNNGGGIRLSGGVSLALSSSTVSANHITANGGGIGNAGTGPATLTNVTISNNRADGLGGGLRLSNAAGTYNLNNVTITGNLADADLNGTVGDDGGGVSSIGTVNSRNSIIAGNTDPGGQAPDCSGTVTSQGNNLIGNLTGCTFTSASGDITGANPALGALADNGGPTFTHALLSGSPALDKGGAVSAITDQRGVPRSLGGTPDIGAYELVSCKAATVNRVGTEANDVLTGTEGADAFLLLGGNDTATGLGGNDRFCGGGGNDTENGGAGNDQASGDAGNDLFNGGTGNDKSTGDAGKDKLTGGKGKDNLKGGSGKDRLFGNAGKDKLFGGAGKDKLSGGAGKDNLKGQGGQDTCKGGAGKDKASGCEVRKKIP
jgi:CSLREA domain-containing protein